MNKFPLDGNLWGGYNSIGENIMAFDPSKYTVAKARPLPVILLLDRSGSMSGEKISTLNSAVNEMIQS
ncbi:MAG TPA: hypothetical protein DEO40_02225, partial [Treponema sp.]|nr:hypothetical protein [Treponema sp.]